MDKYRLHEVEGSIELFSSDPFIFKPAELYGINGSLREELKKYNIYIVARRPRICFQPSSLNFDKKTQILVGHFSVNLGLEIKTIPFRWKNIFSVPLVHVDEVNYPYDYLGVYANGKDKLRIRIHDVIRSAEANLQPFSDLLVEYVGQSFGDDGDSDAINRLIGKTGKQGHGSLQKVLADINANNPESEAHILLYSFGFYKRLASVGAGPIPIHSFDYEPERFEKLLDAKVNRKERIDLIEAALIRYFQPKYNEIYKKTFPLASHEILNALFELDVTGLATSISTEEHQIRVFSSSIEPSNQHCAIYPIVRDQQRASFFDIWPEVPA